MFRKEKFKRLLSPKAIVGWLLLLWNLLKFLADLIGVLSVVDRMKGAWNFLLSPTGSLISFAVGVALIVWAVLKPSKPKIVKPDNKSIIDGQARDSFVLSSISKLDASQLRQKRNYVSLNYQLASTLPYDLKLMMGKALLVIDNESTEEWVLYPVTIKKQSSEPWYKEITLGEKISASTRERLQSKTVVRIRLFITYWDYEGNEHHFNTD